MKLYIEDKKGNPTTIKTIFLDKVATTKKELQDLIGSKEFFIDGNKYFISQVKAKRSSENVATGMLLGGILGAVAGPVGVATGGILGAILGKNNDIQEEEKVKKFNESTL